MLAGPCTLARFGAVLLEAFASGIPIVCPETIGFRRVTRDGAPCRFVRRDDAGAPADPLAEVLGDPDLGAPAAA